MTRPDWRARLLRDLCWWSLAVPLLMAGAAAVAEVAAAVALDIDRLSWLGVAP
jgi:hypothetical protein